VPFRRPGPDGAAAKAFGWGARELLVPPRCRSDGRRGDMFVFVLLEPCLPARPPAFIEQRRRPSAAAETLGKTPVGATLCAVACPLWPPALRRWPPLAADETLADSVPVASFEVQTHHTEAAPRLVSPSHNDGRAQHRHLRLAFRSQVFSPPHPPLTIERLSRAYLLHHSHAALTAAAGPHRLHQQTRGRARRRRVAAACSNPAGESFLRSSPPVLLPSRCLRRPPHGRLDSSDGLQQRGRRRAHAAVATARSPSLWLMRHGRAPRPAVWVARLARS